MEEDRREVAFKMQKDLGCLRIDFGETCLPENGMVDKYADEKC
jgi:hypothetical protein